MTYRTLWVVRHVMWSDNHWIAQAEPLHVDDSEPRPKESRMFHVNDVLHRIVVEEEIELFQPRWASGNLL